MSITSQRVENVSSVYVCGVFIHTEHFRCVSYLFLYPMFLEGSFRGSLMFAPKVCTQFYCICTMTIKWFYSILIVYERNETKKQLMINYV